MTFKALGTLVLSLLLTASSQLLMKHALNTFKLKHGAQLQGLRMLFRALLTWGVMIAVVCNVISVLLYLRLMWDTDVSMLYPMVALNYVFVTILAAVFLKEKVPSIRILGLALIIGGVAVYFVWGAPPADEAAADFGAAVIERVDDTAERPAAWGTVPVGGVDARKVA